MIDNPIVGKFVQLPARKVTEAERLAIWKTYERMLMEWMRAGNLSDAVIAARLEDIGPKFLHHLKLASEHPTWNDAAAPQSKRDEAWQAQLVFGLLQEIILVRDRN